MSDKLERVVNSLTFGADERLITYKPYCQYTAIFTNNSMYLMGDNGYLFKFYDIKINPDKEILFSDDALYFECLSDKQTYCIAPDGALGELRLIKFCNGYLDLLITIQFLQQENTRKTEALKKILSEACPLDDLNVNKYLEDTTLDPCKDICPLSNTGKCPYKIATEALKE